MKGPPAQHHAVDMLPFEDTEKEKLYLRREQFYAEEEHIPRKTY